MGLAEADQVVWLRLELLTHYQQLRKQTNVCWFYYRAIFADLIVYMLTTEFLPRMKQTS